MSFRRRVSRLEGFKMAMYILMPLGSIYATTNSPIGEWVLNKHAYLVIPAEAKEMQKPDVQLREARFLQEQVYKNVHKNEEIHN